MFVVVVGAGLARVAERRPPGGPEPGSPGSVPCSPGSPSPAPSAHRADRARRPASATLSSTGEQAQRLLAPSDLAAAAWVAANRPSQYVVQADRIGSPCARRLRVEQPTQLLPVSRSDHRRRRSSDSRVPDERHSQERPRRRQRPHRCSSASPPPTTARHRGVLTWPPTTSSRSDTAARPLRGVVTPPVPWRARRDRPRGDDGVAPGAPTTSLTASPSLADLRFASSTASLVASNAVVALLGAVALQQLTHTLGEIELRRPRRRPRLHLDFAAVQDLGSTCTRAGRSLATRCTLPRCSARTWAADWSSAPP